MSRYLRFHSLAELINTHSTCIVTGYNEGVHIYLHMHAQAQFRENSLSIAINVLIATKQHFPH